MVSCIQRETYSNKEKTVEVTLFDGSTQTLHYVEENDGLLTVPGFIGRPSDKSGLWLARIVEEREGETIIEKAAFFQMGELIQEQLSSSTKIFFAEPPEEYEQD